MKSQSFGTVLVAFADVLQSAGARESRDQLASLAKIFDATPNASVLDVVKRLKALDVSRGSERTALSEIVGLFGPLRQLLAKTAKAGVCTDLDAVEALLREKSSSGLDTFVQLAIEVLTAKPARGKTRAGTSRATTPLRDDLVTAYRERLDSSLGDRDGFSAVYKEMSSNEAMGRAELIALAKQMTGTTPRTKDAALKKIWNWHQSLMAAKAKALATGGRSAA